MVGLYEWDLDLFDGLVRQAWGWGEERREAWCVNDI